MSTTQRNSVIGVVVGVVLLLFVCNGGQIFPSYGLGSLLFWPIVFLGGLAVVAIIVGPRLLGFSQPSAPIRDQLADAFAKGQVAAVQLRLRRLPDWPIRQLLLETAQQLFALRLSVQRAQGEGVPATFLQRILNNIDQAAGGIWQIASKVDAVARQRIDYTIIEPKLQLEMQKLAQLNTSLRQSQEGIALLTLSSDHHQALQDAEIDLQALTRAVKLLEQQG